VGGNRLTRVKLTGLIALVMVLIASGCAPAAALPLELPTATAVSTDTPSPTPTIIWFPPTPTYTPRPTQAASIPTPGLLPEHGALILEDDFSSGESWQLAQTAAGNIAVGKNRLNIAINQPRLLLSTLRSTPEIGEFYLEVTARPSLCSGMDEYGVILRAASEADFLRFALSCNGQLRLDRITGGTASSPQPWILSGVVPPGAPGVAQISIWATVEEIRFFVNGQYQFSWNEPALLTGKLGLFARAAADSPVSVSFSDFRLYGP
jgi:hypothetical protein